MSGIRILLRQGTFPNAVENTVLGETFFDPTNHRMWFGRGNGVGNSLTGGWYYPAIDNNNNIVLNSGTYLTGEDNNQGVNMTFDGNNFLVRHNSNNVLIVSKDERVGVGAAPAYLFHVKKTGANDAVLSVDSEQNALSLIQQNSANTSAGFLSFYKRRGTLASPTATLNGDTIGNIAGLGYDNTGDVMGARIQFKSNGPISTGIVPMDISLQTMGVSGILSDVLKIFGSGGVSINSSSLTNGTVFDMSTSTKSFLPPKGTTVQRPAGVEGMIRYNSDLLTNEQFANGSWTPLTGRIRLTGSVTYYVNDTTGNDTTGTGLVGAPWKTIQKALNYIHDNLDLNGFTVTVSVADGTYLGGTIITGAFVGAGQIKVVGNTANPANCILQNTAAGGIVFGVIEGAVVYLKGVKILSNGWGLLAGNGGKIYVDGQIELGACTTVQLNATGSGSQILMFSSYKVSGGSAYHTLGQDCAQIISTSNGITVTVVGNPNFSVGFFVAKLCGIIHYVPASISGSFTGPIQVSTFNGAIEFS